MNAAEPTDASSLDVTKTKVVRQWKHSAPLLGCRYDPKARFVFAASMDQAIWRWDLESDTQVSFRRHDSWLRGLGFSESGDTLYTGGYDGRLCFWETAAEPPEGQSVAPTRTIDAHEGWIRALAVAPGGELIATAGNDLTVKLWSAESGELVRTLEGHQKHIYSLMFHPSGELLLSGDLQGQVKQWNYKTGELVRTLDAKPLHTYHGGQQVDYGGVRCMALSPDGTQLAMGGLHKATNPFAGVQEPLVLVFDWDSGKQVRTHEATEVPRGIVWRLAYESDGTLTGGIGGQQGYLLFWGEPKTESHKMKLPSPVLDMDHHPNRAELATAHYDGQLRILGLG